MHDAQIGRLETYASASFVTALLLPCAVIALFPRMRARPTLMKRERRVMWIGSIVAAIVIPLALIAGVPYPVWMFALAIMIMLYSSVMLWMIHRNTAYLCSHAGCLCPTCEYPLSGLPVKGACPGAGGATG